MTIFRFVFKRFFSKPSNILFLSILPIATVFLPVGGWLPLPLGFQYYGIILLFIAARLSSIIMDDRTNRTLLRIGAAPVTHFQYLLQNLLAYSLILIGVNAFVVIVGVLVHGEKLISPTLLFILYSFFSMTAIGFSLAWYSLFRNKEAASSVLTGVIMLMALLGGTMWPIEAMPILLQSIGMLIPIYWLVDGTILVVTRAPIFDFLLPLAIMLMFSVVFILLGSRRKIA